MAGKNFNVERSLKTLHGWLGVFILPWVIIIGLTGLYLNHKTLVKSALPFTEKVGIELIDQWPNPITATANTALNIARDTWPQDLLSPVIEEKYRGQPVYTVHGESAEVNVVKRSGHYWIRSRYTREFFDPGGQRLNHYFGWSRLFKRLHTDGWVDGALGSWLADVTAGALVLFGASGLVLFFKPRLRRRKNRRARTISSFPSSHSTSAQDSPAQPGRYPTAGE